MEVVDVETLSAAHMVNEVEAIREKAAIREELRLSRKRICRQFASVVVDDDIRRHCAAVEQSRECRFGRFILPHHVEPEA